ncbi:MAG: 4-(cytidine 5'-diphospho)-2-C-methyl-D-erythritol kinase [Proteobacteria bacterium]|nr:4-(cytidine 5'-diphospho)-2-C-methyl-D-erythritol kinase [Pseudomonadota bacterium]MBU4297671.1 4-(cytidine 5'-diphospho)-2-C-methyl-D-erythritol kinase [Pseudomonadota bacterium]MCG2748384.1 4-(cytidine 5'-diphospho)-2-C-methyl-D-erythritol kinase [Desulfobulbaceae bacterium]
MISGRKLHLQAPAKINLYLKVLGRCHDGYHELSTWMQKITLADEITLSSVGTGIKLLCSGADLATDESNLAHNAAVLFLKKTGLTTGVEIELVKNIPIAAGLGGGSSDAAAVLTGLNTLFSAGLSDKELMELGLSLGADVPFFVSGCSAAIATGIGEKLEKKDSLKECWFVLVNPGFPVSTKWVFENFDRAQTVNFTLTSGDNPYILGREIDWSIPEKLFNDLERVTVARYPEVSKIKKELTDLGASGVLMSGSGPTVFGIFLDSGFATQCVINLQHVYPGRVFLTEPLSSS